MEPDRHWNVQNPYSPHPC